MDFLKRHRQLVTVGVLIAVIFFFAGFKSGQNSISLSTPSLENRTLGKPGGVDFSPFWKAWNILEDKYVPASSTEVVTNDEKVWGAIQGLAESLGDPYTVFFPPVESELFESDIRGNFEGVGMEIVAKDGAVTVIAPIKGGPAERAGVRAGDKVIRIDGNSTAGLSTEDAVQVIRGVKGTKVVLTIFRTGTKEPFDISIIRDVINIPTIKSQSLGNNIYKIDLYSFSAPSPNQFRQALREFILSGDDKLILDMRGNPGGYLEAAIDIASWFLPPGKIVVREDFGGTKDETVYRSKGYDVFPKGLDFVILVDGGSASAAEILAGALSEHGVATLVGEKTFGKGSVQELVDITSKTSLKVTIARWLTPNGSSISDVGITPEYVVKRTQADYDAGKDLQLDKAIEILNK
jgi:carboxyl-terminal processing protease